MIYSEAVTAKLVEHMQKRVYFHRDRITDPDRNHALACLMLAGFLAPSPTIWYLNAKACSAPVPDIVAATTLVHRDGRTAEQHIAAAEQYIATCPRSWTALPDGWVREGCPRVGPPTFVSVARRSRKWGWVVFRSHLEMSRADTALAHGLSLSESDAVQAALAHVPDISATRGTATALKVFFRRLRVAEAMNHPKVTSDRTTPTEVLYDGLDIPHAVLRKTARSVFVSEMSLSDIDAQLGDPHLPIGSRCDIPCNRLNRITLERDGQAWTTRSYILYLKPSWQRRQLARCFVVLGLPEECSEKQAHTAFRRLVKQAHPDKGGSSDKFIALRNAYEEALRIIRQRSANPFVANPHVSPPPSAP